MITLPHIHNPRCLLPTTISLLLC